MRLIQRQVNVTYDLLDDLAGRVQVDEALVDLELVAVPGLGSLTTGLPGASENFSYTCSMRKRTVLRVVMRRTLVGRRTGPLTRSCLSFARLMRSAETVVMSIKPRQGKHGGPYISRGS